MTIKVLLLVPALLGAQQTPIFRSAVDLVRVPAVVTDRAKPVRGLTAKDFTLLDSHVAQTVDVTPLSDLALDVTVVLDVSGSVNGPALDELRGDVQAIAASLQSHDRIRLITFGEAVRDVFGFQPGGGPLPVDRIRGGGLTSLYAALAAALMTDPATDRPQLVFALTDGLDTISFFDARRIVALANATRAALYVALVKPSEASVHSSDDGDALDREHTRVSYPTGGAFNGATVERIAGIYSGGPNVSALKNAVVRTGGALYDKNPGTLVSRFQRALDDFRSGYLLTYTPAGVARGGWHEIAVRTTRRHYSVRARGGYDGG